MKEPRPGRVKTRLARDIGPVAAAWWYRHQTARLIRRLVSDPRWETVLAVAPDTAAGSRVWPGLPRIPQGPGDLGLRMGRVLAAISSRPVLIVGSDIPRLGPGHVAYALGKLGGSDIVLGPAPDGGYWAIGRRAGLSVPKGCLAGIRWSSHGTRADTVSALRRFTVALADPLADVDTAADL